MSFYCFLVLQIGEQGDWYNGIQSLSNVQCEGETPNPANGTLTSARINWYLHMLPAHRCVVKGLHLEMIQRTNQKFQEPM